MELTDIINLIFKAIQTVIQVKKAVDTKNEIEYQSEILKKEAEQAKEQAADERQAGVEEARRIRLKSILTMSETKTDIASGNILLSSPTAINLVDDEKLNGELDALITQKNYDKRAESYMKQSQKYYQNAALKSFNSKSQILNSSSNSLLNLGHSYALVGAKYKSKE